MRQSTAVKVDWDGWMRAMGRFTRRLRLFVGWSQAQLARRAGVSQAAISSLESGRALNTPMVVNHKIHLAMRHGLATLPADLLSSEVRRLMEVPALDRSGDPLLREVIELFSSIRPAWRGNVLDVVRPVAEMLAGVDAEPEGRSGDDHATPQPDPNTWIRSLGASSRRLRIQAGLSQERLARSAGVSQGAVSRYEARSAGTPMLVVMKVNAALRREIAGGRLSASMEESRRLMSIELRGIPRSADGFATFPVATSVDLETLTRLFWTVPSRQRERLADVLRATVRLCERASLRVATPPAARRARAVTRTRRAGS